MKKTIQTLSTISLAIAAFSMLRAVGFLTVLWEPLCSRFGYPESAIDLGPVLPLGVTASMVGGLAVCLIVFFSVQSPRVFVGEIISAALVSVIVPVLSRILTYMQSLWLNHFQGSDMIIALSLTSNMVNYAHGIMNVATALCLVVCGMSISEKLGQKSQPSVIL